MEPLRRHRRGLRQGPRHGGRAARPQRCHQPRGVRPRAAAQRALRVPQHRRPQDEHVARAAAPRRTRWPTCCPPELLRFLFLRHKPRARHRVRPRGRHHPGPVRRVRPGRRGHGGQARPRRAAARPGADLRGRASWTPTPTQRSRRPASGRRSATSRCWSRCPAWTLEARMAAEKGAPLDEAERAILERARRASRATWLEGFAPERYRVAVQDELPDRGGGADRGAGIVPRRTSPTAAEASDPSAGDAWQDLIFRASPAPRRLVAATRSRRCTRVPRSRQRAARRLAAGEPRPRRSSTRACAPRRPRGADAEERTERRTRRVSVGVAAPARRTPTSSAQGAIAKGEDPALVDEALALDARRRDAARPGRRPARRAQAASRERIGAAIRGGADAQRAGGRRSCASRSTALGRRDRRARRQRGRGWRRELDELLLRIPNPPDPGIPVGGEEASVIVRTLGRAAAARGTPTTGRRRGRAGRTGRSPRRWA